MVQYDYEIYSLTSYPTYEGESDVVFNITYQLVAYSGSARATANEFSTAGLNVTYQSGSSFIPYDQLTKDTVIGWIEFTLGQEEVNRTKNKLKNLVESQINSAVSLPLPFNN
jgi:hypothetical protein